MSTSTKAAITASLNINPDHPVFALAFCVVEKAKYIEKIVPAFQWFKFDFWGHDSIVLHGHEIRKATGDFNILLNPNTRASFIDRVTQLIGDAELTLIAAVIDKAKHVKKYSDPADPYSIALGFCMERLQRFLIDKGQANVPNPFAGRMPWQDRGCEAGAGFRRRSATVKTPSARCRTSKSLHGQEAQLDRPTVG